MILSVSQSQLNGALSVPGSKSHTVRAIAIATLADGESEIRTPLVSDDTVSCLCAASELGAGVSRGDDTSWRITGTGGRIRAPQGQLDMGNSGTGLRIFSALAALDKEPIAFTGDASLRRRPMGQLLDSLRQLGVSGESHEGHCPISVRGPLNGGSATVDGTSSQYLTALLIACPLARQDTRLHVPFLNERPYVGMTLAWLKRQQIRVEYDADMTCFAIPGNQHYHAFHERIPGDFSSAAFPITAAVISGGALRIDNLDFADPQGDKAIVDLLARMGADIVKDGHGVSVRPSGKRLHAEEFDMNAVPDLVPVLAAAAACAEGVTVLRNVRQARYKECDRIAVMAEELTKMGIHVEEFEDGLAVTGGELKAARVDSHGDHRIAMALAVAGMACARDGSGETTQIDGAECIAVTYPGFVTDFSAAGAKFALQKA